MSKHTLSSAQIVALEADRLAALAAHAALPALKAAVGAAQDALAVGESQLAGLLERIAHAGFAGLDIHDEPPKMHAREPAAAPGPKASAVATAKAAIAKKLG